MKIATWNVNSLKVRLPHLLEWLAEAQPDVVGLQETKLQNENFPADALREAGYEVAFHGQKTYNGVALIARSQPQDVWTGLSDGQARVITGSVDGVRIICAYVVNGQAVGSEKFAYKMSWLQELKQRLSDELQQHEQLVLMGDFNIAPRPCDTHDPEQWEGKILCSDEERAALTELLDLGLVDPWTRFDHGDESAADNKDRFTWWDYRAAGFRRNLGLRIDHTLITPALDARCTDCRVDLAPRRLERPSDHAPVVVTLD
ncbi:exodeoxyribonuclease III [Oceanococcus atlanticus]|uniref:Exodeoxyribonuclease III n=1 Tax=Oceanococcus atlanticus TaxID=1317117 RepID=A0A1Y1SBB6_9GAMM|nr:exodeoxyribonuclease III [Oceanococcus atlanticus]ORE85434.1 exodeoxyribonuclease III [Oceanococcus atlanticus]